MGYLKRQVGKLTEKHLTFFDKSFCNISFEIFIGFIFFIIFHSLLFGVYENSFDVFVWLWLPISIGIISMYSIGWYLGNQLPEDYPYKIYHGIIILFSLLIVAVLMGCFIFSLQGNNDLDDVTSAFIVLLIFLIFGGLPTLFVGVWLGVKLKEKEKPTKTFS